MLSGFIEKKNKPRESKIANVEAKEHKEITSTPLCLYGLFSKK
jgi:hypothetical protein